MDIVGVDTSDSLEDYIGAVSVELNTQKVVLKLFSDLSSKIPIYTGRDFLQKEELCFLAEKIEAANLCTMPKISQGNIERGIDSPLLFYPNLGEVNFDSQFYKYARLVVQISVVMARADNQVDISEAEEVERLIWRQKGIGEKERLFLLAKAKYFLAIEGAYDERYRDYVKIALSQKTTIKKMEELSDSAKRSLLEVAKEIAVADGYLDQKELNFIKDIYRIMGLSVRSAKKDVEDYAKARYINLDTASNKTIDLFENDIFEELDDVLGDLLSDFEDF